jgi:hypothetical protein
MSPGAKTENSRIQFSSVEEGTMTRWGPFSPLDLRCDMRAMTWAVFPRPAG